MSRFIRIVIFTLLMAGIVFFGFKALQSSSSLETNESNRSHTESSKAEQAENPPDKTTLEVIETSNLEVQSDSSNKDPSENNEGGDKDKESVNENNSDTEKPK